MSRVAATRDVNLSGQVECGVESDERRVWGASMAFAPFIWGTSTEGEERGEEGQGKGKRKREMGERERTHLMAHAGATRRREKEGRNQRARAPLVRDHRHRSSLFATHTHAPPTSTHFILNDTFTLKTFFTHLPLKYYSGKLLSLASSIARWQRLCLLSRGFRFDSG